MKILILLAILIVGCRGYVPSDDEIYEYIDEENISQEQIEEFIEDNPEHEERYEEMTKEEITEDKSVTPSSVTIKGRVEDSKREKTSVIKIGETFEIESVTEGGHSD